MEYTKISKKSLTKKWLLVTFNYAKAAEAFTGLSSRLFRSFSKQGSVQCEGVSASFRVPMFPLSFLVFRSLRELILSLKTLAKFRPPLLIFAERRPGICNCEPTERTSAHHAH